MASRPRGFASDNYAGILPEVLAAIASANAPSSESPSSGPPHAGAYGADALTTGRLAALIRRHFGPKAVAFPVFNGTGANVISLLAACPRHAPAAICAESSHAHCDEGGAPEAVGGLKLHTLRVPRGDGKLTPELVESALFDRDSVHRAQASVVSIANTTEMGTVYSPAEVRALADHAHARGLLLHLDGARISNAAAALGCALREFTTDAGVDVVSFGGTKAGAMGAEAVVVLNDALLPALPFLRKTSMQLASKQRFIAAQLVALLEAPGGGGGAGGDDGDEAAAPAPLPLCVRAAAHANAMAARLLAGVRAVAGVELPVEGRSDDAGAGAGAGVAVRANAIFPVLPARVTERLWARGWKFYVWSAATGQVRLMASWDTRPEDVDAFVADLREAMAAEA